MLLSKSLFQRFSVLTKLISKKDWHSAISYLESKPNTSEFQSEQLDDLMIYFYKEKRHSESYKLLELLPTLGKQPTEWHFTMVIETSIEAHKISQALNVFYKAQVLEISLDALAYSKLLTGCSKENEGHNIKQVVLKMIHDQSIASPHSLVTALKVATRLKDFALVELILTTISKGKYDLPKSLISSFIVKNSSENKEFESLKSCWKNLLKSADDEKESDSEKETEKKEMYSHGLQLLSVSQEQGHIKDFVTSEDESSDN